MNARFHVCLSILLGTLLISVPVQAEDQPEDPSSDSGHISRLIDRLSGQYLSERLEARKKLVNIGQKVVPDLIQATKSSDYRKRKNSLMVLGKIGDKRGLPVLIDGYLSNEPDIKRVCRKAIVQFGSRSFEHLKSYIDNHPQTGSRVSELVRQIGRRKVEEAFYNEISKEGGIGYYEGQFRELKPLGRRVIPVLKKMARGEYNFYKHPPTPPSHVKELVRYDYFRSMAMNAIGRLGSNKEISFIKSISPGLTSLDPTSRIAAITLARLGEPGPLRKLKKRLSQSYEQAVENGDHFGIRRYGDVYASVLSRTNDNRKAISVYRRLLKYREDGIRWYNLACSYAQIGKKEKALNALENAYMQGYDDAGWMEIDGDMEPLRELDEYQDLLQKMKTNTDRPGTKLFQEQDAEQEKNKKDQGDEKKNEKNGEQK